jgi:hypothetical protein
MAPMSTHRLLWAIAASLVLIPACRPAVEITQAKDFTVYRARRVRVYLASEFREPFATSLPDGGYPALYQQSLDELGTLFERGVLTGEMFYDSVTHDPGDWVSRHYYPQAASSVGEALASDSGPLMKILHYRVYRPSDAPSIRNYEIWVTFSAQESGWGSFDIFEVEVSNPRASRETTGRGFASGARLTMFTYHGIQL